MKPKVILYEDNAKLRQSLKLLLNEDELFDVVGDFGNCDNVEEQTGELKADLLVMDIDMPGIGGIEGVRKARNAFPLVKIVMHTVFDDDSRIFDCICAGADGYILKNTTPLKLIRSLQDVMEGDVAMSPYVAHKVFNHCKQNLPEKDPFNLTKRELEILQLLVLGNSYKMIADKCSISLDTVKKHLQNTYGKLHVNCGTEAVAKALRHRIVDN